jgi:D-alanyl-D-alanine carboxypeptidase/D-alanyl-D-alanine-endopeptidase (penicillin-binding protein 4)
VGSSLRVGVVALALGSIFSGDARSQDAGANAADPATNGEAVTDEADDESGDASVPAAAPVPSDPTGKVAWLQVRIGTLLASHPTLAGARVGVSVVDLDTGDALFTRDAGGRYSLASNAKVLTSAAALARLGPEFRWRTTAYAEKWEPDTGTIKGNLYLRGRGDPTLRASDIRALIHDLKLAGVRAIEGQIVFDTTYFDDVVEPPRFADQPKERAGFRAPVSSLSVEQNSVVIVVEPDTAGIFPAEVWLDETAGDYVELLLADVSTVTKGRTRLRVETKFKKVGKETNIQLEISGQIRADQGPEWLRRRIDDPMRFAGEIVKRALSHEQITLGKKKLGRGVVPLTARALAVHESAPLAEVIRGMNKTSNNFVAETVLKTLGAETIAQAEPTPRPATWADGVAAVSRWLTDVAGLPAGSFRNENGSGLFDSSDLTPAQMTQVLGAAWRDFRVWPDLLASLPIMGVDGTVRSRLARSFARGRARAKTGTLAAVSTLAGYVAVESDHPLAFAILVNDIPPGGRGAARALQNQIIEACVAYLGGE